MSLSSRYRTRLLHPGFFASGPKLLIISTFKSARSPPMSRAGTHRPQRTPIPTEKTRQHRDQRLNTSVQQQAPFCGSKFAAVPVALSECFGWAFSSTGIVSPAFSRILRLSISNVPAIARRALFSRP